MHEGKTQLNDGAELPIIFLHGWGMNRQIWQPFFSWCEQAFDERQARPLILQAMDLPGYGQHHDAVAHSRTLAEICRFVDDQIDGACHVLGWSMGGLIATALCLQNPQKYRSLVTVCSNPCFVADDHWPGMQARVLAGFSAQMQNDYKAVISRFIALQTMGLTQAKQTQKLIKAYLNKAAKPHQETLSQGLQLLQATDLRKELPSLQVAHLCILGEKDKLVPASLAESLARISPRTELALIAKSSHTPFLSHPEMFFEILNSFFTRNQKNI